MSVFHWIEKENMEKLYLANIAKLYKLYKAEKKTDRKKTALQFDIQISLKRVIKFVIQNNIFFLNIYKKQLSKLFRPTGYLDTL